MAGRGDQVAFAANWRTVLLVDGLVGVAVAVGGLVLLAVERPLLGALAVAAGLAYVGLVARRAVRWRRLRAEAAASPPPRPPG
jgi:uncharacterized membrane protein